MTWTPRERVLAAITHEEADRVPPQVQLTRLPGLLLGLLMGSSLGLVLLWLVD